MAKIKIAFLFLNCITLVKNVTQRIFDKRFCCLYISVFVLAKSIFKPFLAFLSLFCPPFTCLYKRTHKLSFLVQSKKKVFFFKIRSRAPWRAQIFFQSFCTKKWPNLFFNLFALGAPRPAQIFFQSFCTKKWPNLFFQSFRTRGALARPNCFSGRATGRGAPISRRAP